MTLIYTLFSLPFFLFQDGPEDLGADEAVPADLRLVLLAPGVRVDGPAAVAGLPQAARAGRPLADGPQVHLQGHRAKLRPLLREGEEEGQEGR